MLDQLLAKLALLLHDVVAAGAVQLLVLFFQEVVTAGAFQLLVLAFQEVVAAGAATVYQDE